MKKIITLVFTVICLMAMLTGCDLLDKVFLFDKTNELAVEIPTGDNVEFLITKDSGYKLEMNRSTRHYEVTDKDGNIIMDIVFRSEKDLKSYCDTYRHLMKAKLSFTTSTFVYSVCENKDDNSLIVIGWLLGTNTGFAATSNVSDKEQINHFFENCSFNITSTTQQNSEYYPNFVKMK